MTDDSVHRYRLLYIGLAFCVMIMGLLSRTTAAEMLPVVIAEYSGDCLWALLIYMIIAVVKPAAKSNSIAGASMAFALTIESSQLFEADWANQIRDLPGMRLVFGYGFLWSDLASYSVGIAIAWILDGLWLRRQIISTPAVADSGEQQTRMRAEDTEHQSTLRQPPS